MVLIIRARASWHEHGEKSLKYFLDLEKNKLCQKKHMRKWKISGSDCARAQITMWI